jgi:hypothetical protein
MISGEIPFRPLIFLRTSVAEVRSGLQSFKKRSDVRNESRTEVRNQKIHDVRNMQ